MITRRMLFGRLPFLLLGRCAGMDEKRPAVEAQSFRIDAFYVAGFQYHAGPPCEGAPRVGDAVRLVGEPENPHDERAVRVEWGGRHIGYAPRTQNRILSRMLAAGAPLQARVDKVNAEEPPWHRVKIAVEMMGVVTGGEATA